MRIPMTQADWPAAFNDTSKFIGRHWPLGKLKLNQSREITAYLFGYNSVHDLQQELSNELTSKKYFSVNDMSQSMSLRALVKFSLSPLTTKKLFNDIPWRSLSVWTGTREAQEEALEEQRRAAGQPRIYVDEWGRFGSYKSPELLVKMIDDGRLPSTEYAVNKMGLMYRRSVIENMLSGLDISQDELAELSFNGTQEDFIREYIEPISWGPIKDQLKGVSYDNKVEWFAPYLRRVDTDDNGYRIFHEGYNAYYSPIYASEDELTNALKELFLGNPISIKPLSDQDISVDAEYFSRADILKDYNAMRSSDWLSTFAWPSNNQALSTINANALPANINNDHDRIERWIYPVNNRTSKLVTASQIGPILARVMIGERNTLETLQLDDEYTPNSYGDESPEEQTENIKECDERIAEATRIGAGILQHHPELRPYYDEVAACDMYQDYAGNTRDWFYSCYERTERFVVYVFGKACIRHFKAGCKEWQLIASFLLDDIVSKKLTDIQCESAWLDACELLSLHTNQSSVIVNMRRWSSHEAVDNSKYETCGAKAKLTRKSSNESMLELMKMGRKFKSEPKATSQTHLEE